MSLQRRTYTRIHIPFLTGHREIQTSKKILACENLFARGRP